MISATIKSMCGEWIKTEGDYPYWWIRGRECLITLEPRPNYCDRGNLIAKLFPEGQLALDIDRQDGWPRYYFDEERAKAEIEAWLSKRGQLSSAPLAHLIYETKHRGHSNTGK